MLKCSRKFFCNQIALVLNYDTLFKRIDTYITNAEKYLKSPQSSENTHTHTYYIMAFSIIFHLIILKILFNFIVFNIILLLIQGIKLKVFCQTLNQNMINILLYHFQNTKMITMQNGHKNKSFIIF